MDEEKKEEFENHDDTQNKNDEMQKAQQIAWLSYLGILVIVPILIEPNNEYIKFHARQGIVLLLFEIGWTILRFILGLIPVIKYIAAILSFFMWVGFVALSVIGIINAIQGEWKKLPLVGEFADTVKII